MYRAHACDDYIIRIHSRMHASLGVACSFVIVFPHVLCQYGVRCRSAFRCPVLIRWLLIVPIYIYIYKYISCPCPISRQRSERQLRRCWPAGCAAMPSSSSAAAGQPQAHSKPGYWNDDTGACLKYFRPLHITDYQDFCFCFFIRDEIRTRTNSVS
jgi:hypothetical protein